MKTNQSEIEPAGSDSAGNLKYFTQTAILRQIGHRRLARLLLPFDEDLKAVGLGLPKPDPDDDDYFADLACALSITSRLPGRLRQTLQTIELAAFPENNQALWSAIKRRIPQVSVSGDCALDRALDLWFLAPEEFSQFIAPALHSFSDGGPSAFSPQPSAFSETPTSAFSIEPLAFPAAPPTPVPPPDSTIQLFNVSTPSPPADSTIPRFNDSTCSPTNVSPVQQLDDSTLCHETDQQAFARLGGLSLARYDRLRHAEAKRLQIRLETLDAEVAQARTELGYDAEARAVKLPPVEPWPEPVDGCQVLHQVRARFQGGVILPPGASQILALWPTHAHCFEAFLHTPRLNLTSAEAECGKSTTVDILATLAPRSLSTENLRAPVLFRLVAMHQPTVFLDEVDTYLTFAHELRGLINAGHKQGGCAYRCEGRGIRQIFTQSGATRISSKQLVEGLRSLAEARSLSAGGETDATLAHRMGEGQGVRASGEVAQDSPLGTPYSALSWLARGLQPFGIKSRVMRIGTQCAKGYDLADFTDAFARFLNP